MRVTKKPYSRVIFFSRCKSCKPAYTTYSKKKKITPPDGFFVTRIYSEKKNYTTYSKKKKITRPDGFFVTRIYSEKKKLHDLQQKKKLHDLQQKKKITRPDGFLLHTFTAEKKSVRGYVATLPTCGPLLILPPALQRLGSPIRQG